MCRVLAPRPAQSVAITAGDRVDQELDHVTASRVVEINCKLLILNGAEERTRARVLEDIPTHQSERQRVMGGRKDSNLHALAGASPSSRRVQGGRPIVAWSWASGSCPDLRKFRIIAVRGDGPVLLIG